jgi:hypothetical protein
MPERALSTQPPVEKCEDRERPLSLGSVDPQGNGVCRPPDLVLFNGAHWFRVSNWSEQLSVKRSYLFDAQYIHFRFLLFIENIEQRLHIWGRFRTSAATTSGHTSRYTALVYKYTIVCY